MAGQSCMVNSALAIVQQALREGTLCPSCTSAFHTLLYYFENIRRGQAEASVLEEINSILSRTEKNCTGALGHIYCHRLRRLIAGNWDDFVLHVINRVCPQGSCPQLTLPPCQAACPAGIDIPGYIALIAAGRHREALERILEDVPLPGVLGRICEHPCAAACRRAAVDGAVAICALKRFAWDAVAVAGEKPVIAGESNLIPLEPSVKLKPDEESINKGGNSKAVRVAVIGAGPAGLACAYFLARFGCRVTVFEAMSRPGGMLAYGIPPYRLPREVLWRDIAAIEALGVEIRLNSPVSSWEEIEELRSEGYAAVFLATGAWQGSLPLASSEKIAGVWDGVTFLRTVNAYFNGEVSKLPVAFSGKRVVVVGGGNVAIDAARVAVRLGAAEVRILYRRTRKEMPALTEEVEAAQLEGIIFDFLVAPLAVESEEGKLKGLKCIRCRLQPAQDGGRPRPEPVPGSEFLQPAEIIIFATGQKPDLSFLKGRMEGGKAERHIPVDPVTMATPWPGVFAGGDAVTGPASAIKAIAAGKRAAFAIYYYLRNQELPVSALYPRKRLNSPQVDITAEERARGPVVELADVYNIDARSSFAEILRGLREEEARAEAARCLRCDLCIACGRCQEVCRDEVKADALRLGYTVAGGRTDFLRPKTKCIGCGSCAVNCPTGAITIRDGEGWREMRMAGMQMSRLPLLTCQQCNRPLLTAQQAERVLQGIAATPDLCEHCRRSSFVSNVFKASFRKGQN